MAKILVLVTAGLPRHSFSDGGQLCSEYKLKFNVVNLTSTSRGSGFGSAELAAGQPRREVSLKS
jgi:hypothetical protein